MNWVDELLEKAWQKRPRGGVEPFVIYPTSGAGLDEHEMRGQLEEMAQRERQSVERTFAQWASTGRWLRSTRCSGWIIREILSEARYAGTTLSNNLDRQCGSLGEARSTAVFLAICSAWYETLLPVWAAEEARSEYAIHRLVEFDP